MMDVEVLLRFVVDVYFELGDFVFCFCGYEEVVSGQYFEFFAFVVVFVLSCVVV